MCHLRMSSALGMMLNQRKDSFSANPVCNKTEYSNYIKEKGDIHLE